MEQGITLQALSDKLDRIQDLTLLGVKNILTLPEAAMLTGFSEDHLYRLTSRREIPHYKKNRKLYFNKQELEDWLTNDRVKTGREINSRAATYIATHRMKV